MFMPALEKLRDLCPDSRIDIHLECGQEAVFDSAGRNDDDYELRFCLHYPMSEGSRLTKTEKCCHDELGITPPDRDVAVLPDMPSPLVACHFQGTALPDSVNCPAEIAYQIWVEIKEAGKIPIECHFEHVFHNPVNEKYSFIDNSVRKYHADLKSLIGLIQRCFACIAVASGPFVTALSIMPDRLLFIQKHHKLASYTKQPIEVLDVFNYREGQVRSWLESLS